MIGVQLPANANYLSVNYSSLSCSNLQLGLLNIQKAITRGVQNSVYGCALTPSVPVNVSVLHYPTSALECSHPEGSPEQLACLRNVKGCKANDMQCIYSRYWDWCSPGSCSRSHKKGKYFHVVEIAAYLGGIYAVGVFIFINVAWLSLVAALKWWHGQEIIEDPDTGESCPLTRCDLPGYCQGGMSNGGNSAQHSTPVSARRSSSTISLQKRLSLTPSGHEVRT